MSRELKTVILWLLILAALPWPLDYVLSRGAERKDRRDEELFRRHDCGYYKQCEADFDRDGTAAQFKVEACESALGRCLYVSDGGREVLRLPFHTTDNTLRTHLAVHERGGTTRLLVFDGIAPHPPRRLAFAWRDGTLVATAPDARDLEIIDAMAAYDDGGTMNERIFRDIIRVGRFVVYYLLLAALAGILLLWGKPLTAAGARPRTHETHFLRRRHD